MDRRHWASYGAYATTLLLIVASCGAGLRPGPQLLDPSDYPSFGLEGDPLLRGSEREEGHVAVYGYIVAASSGERIDAAQVRLDGRPHGALSTLDGRYRLWAPPGEHQLLVDRIGYTSAEAPISVMSSAVRLDFVLEVVPMSLQPMRASR